MQYWIGTLVVSCAAGIICASLFYKINPFRVLKIILRAIVLQSINYAVKIFDYFFSIFNNTLNFEKSDNINFSKEDIAEFIGSKFPDQKVVVTCYNNNLYIKSAYSFGYQSLECNLLHLLREKNKLSTLIVPGVNDFIQICCIANWVHGQWLHGTSGAKYFDPGKFNADIILNRAQRGDRFWCHVYAMTFIQVAASLGHQARLVSLTKDGYQSSDMHAIAEVWSNYFAKWIALDVDFNIWYTREQVPLNVLEIHDAILGNEIDGLEIQKGIIRPPSEFEKRIPSLYKYYRYFYIDMRNNWLSQSYFPGHPKRSDRNTLFWVDDRLPSVLNLQTKVSNKNDIYWDLNRTHVNFSITDNHKEKSVEILLNTLTPNFSHFEIVLDDEHSENVNCSSFRWMLHSGRNMMKVRSVNSAGINGIESKIIVSIEKE